MSDWMSNAQKRLEQERIQEEAQQQQIAQQQAAQDAPILQELQSIIDTLRVQQKLEDIGHEGQKRNVGKVGNGQITSGLSPFN